MNNLRKISLAGVLLCAMAFAASSQTVVSSNEFYVKITNLNTDSYAVLHHKLKADGRFVIDVACVPAQILKIKMTRDANTDVIKNLADFQLLASEAQLTTAVLLPEFDNAKLVEACSATRNGN
ncbi:MAG: hypothetical protein ACKVOR_04020 [Flavobacteriales bacterium]